MLPHFTNSQLLTLALTHRSSLSDPAITMSNERLEFLGDAVLELVTTEYLFHRFPDEPEGILTSFRAALVKTSTLAKVSKSLGLDQEILMSKGEERSGGRTNESLLADTLEAIIGALYLDQGYPACEAFLKANLFPLFDAILSQGGHKDYKTRLQELVQSQGKSTPLYTTIKEVGPDHQKEFTVQVLVDNQTLAQGAGKSKQEASQEAAKRALEKLAKP